MGKFFVATRWSYVLEKYPLSFNLLTRNADLWTKKHIPELWWIYDRNVPASRKYLPEFFKANEISFGNFDSDKDFFNAFEKLELNIKNYDNRNKNQSKGT